MADSPVGSQIEELDRQIADTVTKVVRDLQRKLGERVRESSEEVLRRLEEEIENDVPRSFISEAELSGLVGTMAPPVNPAQRLLAAISRIDSQTAQADVLAALVQEAHGFASRAAFFLVREGQVRGFRGAGFEAVEQIGFAVPSTGAWSDLAHGGGTVGLDAEGCGELADRLGAETGSDGILIPFVLRGQLAGALFADRAAGGAAPDSASLQLLTHSAAQALETLAFRAGSGASPALRPAPGASTPEPQAEEPRSDAVASEPEPADAEPDAEPAEAVQPESTAELGPTGEEDLADDAGTAPEPDVSPEVAVEPAPQPARAIEEPPHAEPDSAIEPVAVEPASGTPEPVSEPEYVEPETFVTPSHAEFPEPTEVEPPSPAVEAEFAVEPEPAESVEPMPRESSIWEEDDEPTVIGQRHVDSAMPSTAPSLPEGVGQQTVRLDVSQLDQAPAPPTESAVPEFELEPEPPAAFGEGGDSASSAGFELEPEALPAPETAPPADLAPTQVAPPADLAPTQVTPPADLASTPPVGHPESFDAPPPAPPVAPSAPASAPAPAPAAGGTTEVRPPEDLDGPGLAFAAEAAAAAAGSAIPAGEEALHEEARRLARLLVSEIKLYNEEVIEEGRMAGNIYSRLKEDIDRSRQMYNERIDPRIQDDYFYQELVQRLAGGDPKLLGM